MNEKYFFKPWFMAFLLVFIISGCQTRAPDYGKVSVFTPAEVKADSEYLFRALNEVHVSAWNNISQQNFSKKLEKITDDNFWLQTRLDIYRKLAPLVAAIEETHTRLIYPENISAIDGFYNGGFPLYLLNEVDGLFVVGDRSLKQQIPVGAKILSINGVSTEQLLFRMGQFIPAETEAGQRRQIQMNFEQLLVRELGFQAPFKVSWQFLSQQNSASLVDRKFAKQTVPNSEEALSWGLETINAETRLLWISDFESPPEKFSQFLETLFQQLGKQQVKSLVIDLRYNWGGVSENVLKLLSYLAEEPVLWAKKIRFQNTEIFRDNNREKLKQVKNEKFGSTLDWLPLEYLSGWNWRLLFSGGGDHVEDDIQPEMIQPAESRYHGQLAVLVNGHCFSACAFFVDAVQHSGRGLVVGETAGSRVGIQYGYPVLVTLPNTGLQLQLPAAEIHLADKAYKVIPDILVFRRSEDIANRSDPEMAAALSALEVLR